jgi:4-amino-4-deoxy-L-arabinose transferase-like glycosyltransferase
MKILKGKTLSDPVIIGMALLSILMHLIIINNLEYHRDELLYFSLGMHPAAGYATVPPLIGWLAWLIQNLFGYSIYAVRIIPALTSGIMILIVARMAKELGGSRYSQLFAAIGFTIAGFSLRSFSLYMPVFLDIFFWSLCIYYLIRYINSENDKYLLYFGIAVGFSLLNKYLIGVMFAGLLVIIPFTEYRSVFRKRMFWIGIAAAFVIFLPNLIWQINRGLPVFNHMSELNRTQLVNVDRLTFLKEQIMNPAWASVLTVEGLIFR